MSAFQEKKGKVLAIEPSGAVRQLITDLLRSRGFEEVQGLPSVKDAINLLEVEPIDWVITPVVSEKDGHSLQLLKLLTTQPALRETRISYMLEEAELDLVPTCFERGMLNYFTKPLNKASFGTALDDFLGILERYQWNTTRAAAHFLNVYLKDKGDKETQLGLHQSLTEVFPQDPALMLELARHQIANEKPDDARKSLTYAELLGMTREEVEAAGKEIFEEDDFALGDEETQILSNLGINKCLVVEGEDGAREQIKEGLEKMGVKEIQEADNGEAGWATFDGGASPDLIVMEWRLAQLAGPFLLQRIREVDPCVPIIVTSGVLSAQDFPLVREMGVSAFVEKPYEQKDFLRTVVTTCQQEKMPTDAESLERKIRQNIEAANLKEARELWEKYRALDLPSSRKAKMEAEFAYMDGQYERSRSLAVEALTSEADSLVLLNLLAKILMKLGDHESALRCYGKAQSMSPMNITRLCAIAEATNDSGDEAGAQEALDKAKAMDEEAVKLKESTAKIALTNGDAAKAQEMMSKLKSLSKVVAQMNNRAVAHARKSEFDDSFQLYERTLAAIPEDRKEQRAIVSYNVALAYARQDALPKAVEKLEESLGFGETKVWSKANSLKLRIKRAIDKGSKVQFAGSSLGGESKDQPKNDAKQQEEQAVRDANLDVISIVEAGAGEICLFKLFRAKDPPDPKVADVLVRSLRFVPREAITRDSTGGVEKVMKTDS